MTIDEAIAQEIVFSKEDWYDRKQYHEQLAEWLEELKDYRDKNKLVFRINCENLKEVTDKAVELAKEQYNKGVDDTCRYLKNEFAVNNIHCCTDIDNISEQLKVGNNNGE